MKQADIAIIGCGPAGLSAALNVKARNRSLYLAGPKLCSTALHKAHMINNYLGLEEISGEELRQRFLCHISHSDIEITQANIAAIYPADRHYHLQVRDEVIEARAIIITTGVAAGKLIAGEDRLVGKGISYCGTCDALFYEGKTLVVGGDAYDLEDELLFLAEVAAKIYYLAEKPVSIDLPGKIEKIEGKINGFSGEERLQAVHLTDGRSLEADGVFLLKEQLPLTQLLPGLELEAKHIKTDAGMATNLPGVFAAGDVAGRPYQIAKAVGQGQLAALSAVSYVDKAFSQD